MSGFGLRAECARARDCAVAMAATNLCAWVVPPSLGVLRAVCLVRAMHVVSSLLKSKL